MKRYEIVIKQCVAGTFSRAFPRRKIGIFRKIRHRYVIFSEENDICAATCARH